MVHGILDVVVVSAGLLCDRCSKKKTMEVYSKSSWFLLLLGFALLAATLQENTDCPTPDQVSCTTGTKCNSIEDCQEKEICCPNPCYTKRCTQDPKGLQGVADTDGPTETDCRPYIEKALKELETGEVAPTHQTDQDESAEDVPTVEITDDSSHQEADDDDEEEQSDEVEAQSAESEEKQKATKESTQGTESAEESTETQDEKEVEKSDENVEPESHEDLNAEPTKGQDDNEQKKTSAEGDSKEEEDAQGTPEDQGSAESPEAIERMSPQIVKRELPVEAIHQAQFQAAPESNEEEQSAEAEQSEKENSIETQGKNQEAAEEESSEDPKAESQENESVEEAEQESVEEKDKSKDDDDDSKADEDETKQDASTEELGHAAGVSNDDDDKSEETPAHDVELDKIREEIGCPPANQLSCTEGELCSKHKNCGDNRICCSNKCYRKRCTSGTVSEDELLAEQSEEDSEEQISSQKIQAAPSKLETGCPPPDEVSCKDGALCGKHKECLDGEICCPNKCYRRRCTPGTATEAELLAEQSEENSKEQDDVHSAEIKTVTDNSKPETGCPLKDQVSCKEGALCSKHKECGDSEICCPNKCYRKRCTHGTATEAELLAEHSEENSEEEQKTVEVKPVVKTKNSGCPEREDVPCQGGERCDKNRDCGTEEICCPNKCYNKRCVVGTPGSDEEESEEDSKEQEEDKSIEATASSESAEDSDCPSPDKVSCSEGKKCGDDEDCNQNYICCPNKCYTKRCVPGPSTDESEEDAKPAPNILVRPTPTVKVEVKEEVKIKVAAPPSPPPPPEPKKETKKPEPRKSEPKKASKPIIIIEEDDAEDSLEKGREAPVEELSLDTDIPTELRPRDHVEHLLKLDKESSEIENVQSKVYEETLKELKRLYENAIKPLEVLYKYRDLSNRHFGNGEIFAKPLILFMGPWSGGKSTIINYLVNNEYNETSLRTGAEPSPAYFNILMYGDEPEVIDGTELAADFTFSGLQKFGQGLEERLRGLKLPSKLLEKVNIVEIPGILEVRKQVSRVFPFNDACQWFIDRADIIFLVYDPSKLDVGPETEAILDQLKGREHQTRIILNKADQVKPEELMRVQGALIWNISPLMSSPQPPVMYTTSLWSRPYEPWAPTRLLQAQERAFLRDMRTAIDKRIENKIASARRFAVRVRNHAKMVDCYLTTYYNHKSVFGNRKQVANEIIEHPQDYHIYEGLSTLTNISRYDLPDPDVYRDFFKLNPLYEFQQLSATCTYFRGCPINRLDIAIAYDLPELVGNYKRHLEEAFVEAAAPKPKPSTEKSKKSAPGS